MQEKGENKRVSSKALRKDKEQKSFSVLNPLECLTTGGEVLLKSPTPSALDSKVPVLVQVLTLQSFLRTSWGKGLERRFFVPTSSLYQEREKGPLVVQDQNYMYLSLTQTSSLYKAKNLRKLLSKVPIKNKSFISTDRSTSLTNITQGNILSQQNRYRQKSRLNTKSGNFILSYLKN